MVGTLTSFVTLMQGPLGIPLATLFVMAMAIAWKTGHLARGGLYTTLAALVVFFCAGWIVQTIHDWGAAG